MKCIFILNLALMAFINASSQKNPTFYVEYLYKQNVVLHDSSRHKTVDTTITFNDSNNAERTEYVQAEYSIPDFNFETIVFHIANADMSKTFFLKDMQSNSAVTINMNTPDTIFYSKGVWTKLKDGVIDTLRPKTINVKETDEAKNILGYKCIKFVSADSKKGEETIFWACKEMPATLLPHRGLVEFKYGILEVEDLKNKWHTKAVLIKRIDNVKVL